MDGDAIAARNGAALCRDQERVRPHNHAEDREAMGEADKHYGKYNRHRCVAGEVSSQMTDAADTNDVIFEPSWRPKAALIRLNRPKKSNALTGDAARRFIDFLQDAEDNPETCCVVIRGSKTMFSGGADLEEMAHDDPEVTLRIINLMTKLFLAIRTSMLPVMTVVEGPCVGGGYHINLASDYTIATERAWFRHTGVDVGIAPMMPGT